MLMNKQSDSWLNTVKNKPKLRFYALFKEHFYVEKYVCINLSSSERSVLAQLRLGILPLHIETGRFVNTKLEDRTCKICNSVNVEDECHFLFECKAYDVPRNNWVDLILKRKPDFHYLETNDQLKCIFNDCPRSTAKFIKAALVIRKDSLYC
jgi:hypothetical protein